MGIIVGLDHLLWWIGQIPVASSNVTPAQASVLTSGPRFFVALISGVILAFAFQLVLTNLSVAAGISYLGRPSVTRVESREIIPGTFGNAIRKVGTALGLWTLVTVTLALLIASFLAVKLSLLILDPRLGAILGLVIWGAYFLLLVWLSFTTTGSLIGSVVKTATSGLQIMMGTASAAMGVRSVNQQVVATAEAAVAAVRRELGSAIDPTSLRDKIEDYIEKLSPPEINISQIRSEFEKLLNDTQFKTLAGSPDLEHISHQRFIDLVSSRTDLPQREIKRIAEALYSVWRQVTSQQTPTQNYLRQLTDYVKSLPSGQVNTDELNTKLDQLIAEIQLSKEVQPKPNLLLQLISTLISIILERTDLSELDVEKVWRRLTTAKEKVTVQGLPLAAKPYSPIRADVENYLLNTYAWQLSQERIAQEFRDVIYDSEADPETVRIELERLSHSNFVRILQERGLLTQDQIQRVANQLEAVRQNVLVTVTAAAEKEIVQDLRQRVETYLLITNKGDFTAEGIEQDFKPLLADSEVDYQTLSRRLGQVKQEDMGKILRQRNDIEPGEVNKILDELETQRHRLLIESLGLAEQAKHQAETLWLNIESYLRNTGKEQLNPDAIRTELKMLLDNPQVGIAAIQARLSHFDRDTLVKLLSQRQDLSEEEVQQIINLVEESWYSIRHTPQIVAQKAREQYDYVMTTITDYLRKTGKEELNPAGIQQDLSRLFINPRDGIIALRRRLSQIDRDTLVKLLSQRQDLSEEQVNQIIDAVQTAIRNLVRAPRRLATRIQQRVENFQAYLQEYLRQTGKEELNPESIKRDIQLLLHDPRVGMESVSDRLAHFDRFTIISLLKIRADISDAEAARIADIIISVKEQFVQQVRSLQRRIQDTIEVIFMRLRNYLNSLDRPELNYDSISRDIRQLLADPLAGLEALRDRLFSFNRDTLVAILSSREDISQADAHEIIDRIEQARNAVLQRAERLQQETQSRLEAVKHQAQQQAEETRKAAETAAWWLFITAIVSAIFAALGGAIAVVLV